MHGWFEHMSDMIGTCIAAVTAFVVVNAGRLGLGRFSLVGWLAPAVIGILALTVWQRHHRRRFAGPARVASAPAAVEAS